MRALPLVSDPTYQKKDPFTGINEYFVSLIKDERDLPFMHLTVKIMLTMIPMGIALYFLNGWAFAIVAIVYTYLNTFVFKGPFGLMLHCTSHRQWFKNEKGFWNNLLPWFVGPFFGQTPETYYCHHIHMHHAENNLPPDISTTMTYQRDSFKSFLSYFNHFFWIAIMELVGYFKKRNRHKLARKVMMGEGFFIIMSIILCIINWQATIIVFLLPFLLSRFVMMMGNWTQHAFIDPVDPGNPYKNSITCINTKYNHKCWNDGYHISHHQKPHMHWTKHPEYFQKTIDGYAENKALVFEGLDFLQIFVRLVNKRYDELADHLVNVNGMFKTKEEAITLMKQRANRIDPTPFMVDNAL